MTPFVTAANIHKAFTGTPVLRGVSLSVAKGETVCLLGPSGCGKTTLLRIIAGLEQPDQGQVWVEEEEITALPAHQRGFGLMFQDYVLFPHLSVAENIAFGLRMHRWAPSRIAARVAELLEMVELPGFGPRKVYELSGGQQQRVALARSLAPQPRLLMLDEPLGSLDRALRDQLLAELRLLLQGLEQTAIYVTHDQVEAFAIADRVILLNEGRVEQEDAPAALYLHPTTPFAARFLGFTNLLPGHVAATDPAEVMMAWGALRPAAIPSGVKSGDPVHVVLRPEGARVVADAAPAPNRLRLRLRLNSFRGAHTLLRFDPPAPNAPALEFELPGRTESLRPGDLVSLDLDPTAIVVLPGETRREAQGIKRDA